MADLDLLRPLHNKGDKLLVYVFVDEHSRRACADFALIECKQHRTLEGLVQEFVVLKKSCQILRYGGNGAYESVHLV